MFYGAEEASTALVETADPAADIGRRLTYGMFKCLRPLALLDLFDLSALPSYFAQDRRGEWDEVSFLRRFAAEVAKPIRRDGRSHVEYVPTQAFTEFVRFQMRRKPNGGIDGIRYRSSRDGKPCVVLFCTAQQCQLGTPSRSPLSRMWLGLDESSVRSTSVKRAFKKP